MTETAKSPAEIHLQATREKLAFLGEQIGSILQRRNPEVNFGRYPDVIREGIEGLDFVNVISVYEELPVPMLVDFSAFGEWSVRVGIDQERNSLEKMEELEFLLEERASQREGRPSLHGKISLEHRTGLLEDLAHDLELAITKLC